MDHPHELVIDLGKEYLITGFYYLARQDGGWNGTIRECEIQIAATPDFSQSSSIKASLEKTRKPQKIPLRPGRARYVRLQTRSEIHNGPWASIAELGILGREPSP